MSFYTTDKALEFLKNEISSLEKKIEDKNFTPKKLIPYDVSKFDILKYRLDTISDGGSYQSPMYYGESRNNRSREASLKRKDLLFVVCDNILLSLEATKKDNEDIIQHNKTVVSNIISMMKLANIPDTYSEVDKKSRARYPKSISRRSGYLDDIGRHIVTNDYSYTRLLSQIESLKTQIAKECDNRIKTITDEEKEKSENLNREKKEKLGAVLKIKYQVAFDADDADILYAMLSKCKYLHLAHYMLQNRNDWNDGYDYASRGLDSFKIETDVDQKIYDCVESAISDWDHDGRVFRDMEYSYDAIFGMVDAELMEDYNNYSSVFNGDL